jgi:cytoskeletal protein CcmA (bactofilin family)
MFHRVKSEEQDMPSNGPSSDTKKDEAVISNAPDELEEETTTEDTTDTTTEAEDTVEMTESQEPQTEDTQEETTSGFSYQRPAQAAPSRGAMAGYPGSAPYAGASGYGASDNDADGSDRRLTIGAGITMSGEIESCDYLLVEGTVEAALKGANVLEIAESGTFYGTVEIGEANIAGRFEGDITVHGRLTISATGTVTGSIVYKELELEAGAVIDGKLTPLSAVKAATKPAPKKTATAAPKKSAPKARVEASEQEPANNEGGLFSKAAAE